MASDLKPFSIGSPGFYGINTQDSPVSLPSEYALVAKNCVIDSFGRIAARKGWTRASTVISSVNAEIKCIHTYINSLGEEELLVATGNSIYLVEDGEATLLYSNMAFTGSNWKAINFNDKAFFFQRGLPVFLYSGKDSLTTPQAITSPPLANEALSAYGRVWTIDTLSSKIVLNWSDTLSATSAGSWNSGAAGSLDLDLVFPDGNRPAVALAAFNNFLVVFCDKVILIFSGADEDPSTNLALYDIIDNTGCIARDSVQDIGTDILFLSETGLRSLARIISEKSAPILDVSRNVRDMLIADVKANRDNNSIKSVYNEADGFYLLSLPNIKKSYCFDLKNRLENGVCRVTTWDIAPTAMTTTLDKEVLLAFPGFVGKYAGYNDGDTGIYEIDYTTSHLSGDAENINIYKLLKQLRLTIFGGFGYRINIDYGYDYEGVRYSTYKNIPDINSPSYFNVAKYSENKYGDGYYLQSISTALLGNGRVYQVSFRTWVDGYPISIQQIDFFGKLGRIHNNV